MVSWKPLWWVVALLVLGGCASVAVVRPVAFKLDDPDAAPYAQEVFADDPLAHWRLSGAVEGAVEGDEDGATAFVTNKRYELVEGDFGGPVFAVELWVQRGRGRLLTYADSEQGRVVLGLRVGAGLVVELLGTEVDAGVTLEESGWQLIGISWRGSDGLMSVVVDGFEVWRGHVAQGESLPYEGKLVLGGAFVGQVDEVAVFERFLFPSHWLGRLNVARGRSAPSIPNGRRRPRVVQQSGHITKVDVVSWSPDGSMLATANEDGLKIWDGLTGALLSHFAGHLGRVHVLAWSPDGARIASGGIYDGVVRVWDPFTGDLIQEELTGYHRKHRVDGLSWCPDSNRLASLHNFSMVGPPPTAFDPDFSPPPNRWEVWDTTTGKRLTQIEVASPISWSPDGDRLVGEKVWDPATGAVLAEPEADPAGVWSPDRARYALAESVVGSLPRALVHDAGGALKHTLTMEVEGKKPHRPARVRSLSWSPDGAWLAVLFKEGPVFVWDLRSSAARHHRFDTKDGHWILWSPDATQIAMIGESRGSARIRDLSTGAILHDLKGEEGGFHNKNLAWSPDATRFVSAGYDDGSVKIWDRRTNALLHDLRGSDNGVRAVAWSPDGAHLALGQRDGRVAVWHMQTGTFLRYFEPPAYKHGTMIRSLVWSPDGARIASVGDWGLKLWTLATGDLFQTYEIEDKESFSVSWSPDGAWIAAADGGHVKIWDSETGERMWLREAARRSRATVLASAWSPDSSLLALGMKDGRLDVLDLKAGLHIRDIKAHTGRHGKSVWGLSWHKGGQAFATAGEDGQVKVWAVARDSSGVVSVTLEHSIHANAQQSRGNSRGGRFSVAWSPDGTMLASGAYETIKIWDAETRELLRELEGHAGRVYDLSWSPDSTRLAAAGLDNVAKVWDVAQGVAVNLTSFPGQGWIAFTSPTHPDKPDRGYRQPYFSGVIAAPLAIVQGTSAFSIAQLAPSRNRPDKILELLGASAEQVALNEALWLRRLGLMGLTPTQVSEAFTSAPTVRIFSTEASDEAGELRVHAMIRDDAGLQGYQVFVNGVPLSQQPRRVEGKRQRISFPVRLTKGRNEIELSALNIQGIESLRASTIVEHDGEGLPSPRLFFLGFGVSRYQSDDIKDLGFAHQDALDLERVLSGIKGGFAEVKTRAFTDSEVTEAALGEAREFLAEVSEHDTLVMFIAGHGVRDKQGTFFFLDHDTEWKADLAKTAIPFEQMEALLYESSARRKLFLLDTCQSGEKLDIAGLPVDQEVGRGLRARAVRTADLWGGSVSQDKAPLTDEAEEASGRLAMMLDALRDRDRLIVQDLRRRSGAIVLASSLGQESSLERASWSNGAFTEALLDALQSDVADTNKDGMVDTDELKAYIVGAVPKLTGDRQHPNVERDNPNQKFAIPIVAP